MNRAPYCVVVFFLRVPVLPNYELVRERTLRNLTGFSRAKSASDGKARHSERNAMDLRKISPFGRNDNSYYLCAFASLREIFRFFMVAHAAKRFALSWRAMNAFNVS